MFSIAGRAQVGQYTMSISSATATSNTIDVSLSITVTNPSAGMRFGGFSTGINYSTAIVNGGTISAAYLGGKSAELASLNTAAVNTATAGQIRLPIQSLTGSNGVDMAQGVTLSLGTYRITNSVPWATNNANLWLQNTLTTGKTNSLVNGYPFGATSPAASYTTTITTTLNSATVPTLILGYTAAAPLSLAVGQLCASTASQTASTGVTCFGGNNGSSTITLSPTPTVSAITYTVDGGASQSTTLSSGAFTVTGLTAGTHAIVVSNAGCSNVTATGVSIATPLNLVASSSAGSISCFGDSTTVTVSATGGTAPYTGTGSFTVGSGAYSYTVTDANGCSSTTTGTVSQPANLVVSSSAGSISCFGGSTTVTVSATGGTAPYTGTGSFTVSSGAYSYTVTDAKGCSSTTTGTVSQPAQLTNSTTATACDSYTWSVNGLTYTSSGTYAGTTTNGNSCTVNETLNLTINNSSTTSETQTACDRYLWNGTVYTASGVYTYNSTNASGCVNVATLHLTITPSTTNTTPVTACGSYTWSVNGQTYTASGSYTETVGCVTEVLALTINTNTIVSQPVSTTICKVIGGTASFSVVSGSASATYQWQFQTPTGTSWANVVNPTTGVTYLGITSATLSLSRTSTTAPATGTKYRVLVSSACGTALTSDIATLTDQTVLSKAAAITVVTKLTPLLTSCQGSSVTLSLAAGSVGDIQWQSSTDNASWTNEGDVISQTALSVSNLAIPFTTAALAQTTWFRVVASNGVCSSAPSASVKITVSTPAVAGTISGGDVTVCAPLAAGFDASGTALTSTTPITNSTQLSLTDYSNATTIVWQRSTNFVNATGATAVWAAVANILPGTLATSASISGAGTANLTVGNLAATTWFRAVVTNGACIATTPIVKITVTPSAKAGIVTSTTNAVVTTSVCRGGDVTFTSAAYVGSSIAWQVSTVSATDGFITVVGESGLVFTMTNVTFAPLSKFYVRSVVLSGGCTLARSAVKTITVNPLSVAGTVTGGGTVCVAGGGTLSLVGNTGTIQWQFSTDGSTYFNAPFTSATLGYQNPNGATTFTGASASAIAATYVVTGVNDTTYFRARVTSGVCSTAFTNVVSFTVGTSASVGTVSAVATAPICTGTGTTLSLAGSTTGTISWQKRLTTTNLWTNIASSNVSSINTGNLTAATVFRATATIGSCSTVSSNEVTIAIVAAPLAKAVTSNLTTPSGATLALALCNSFTVAKTLSIGTGYIGSVQWQRSTTSTTSGFVDIIGATSQNYTINEVSVGVNYYRAVFRNSCGASVNGTAVTLYYKDCPPPAKQVSSSVSFSVVAYPNPYTETFNLSLSTASDAKVGIVVYDMTGRLLERRDVQPSEMANQQIGDRYPSGVYNIVITQGEGVKTLRVIKR